MQDVGPLLASARSGRTSVKVYEGGIELEHEGQRIGGPWTGAASVSLEIREATINGIRLPTYCLFALRWSGGERIALTTRNKELAQAFQLASAASAPALTRRASAVLQGGEEVDFGAIRLSQERISVRQKKGWLQVPLAELSGFRMTNGHFLADRGTAPARLFAELTGGQLENLPALLALLRSLRPTADLEVQENSRRQREAMSGWPWGPASAVTRWPGMMTGRGRTLLLGTPLALGLLYLLLLLPFAAVYSAEREQQAQGLRSLATLGEKALGQSASDPAPLGEACLGKLEPGEGSTVAYFAPRNALLTAKLGAYDRTVPVKSLVGPSWTGALLVEDLGWIRGGDLMDAWMTKITAGPFYKDPPRLNPARARYLAATAVTGLEVVQSDYGTQRIGRVELDVRVVRVADGRTICSGTVSQSFPKGAAPSSWRAGPVAALPLREICAAGAPSLCGAVAESDQP